MPGRKPPQTPQEMQEAETKRHSNSPIYRRESMELVDERITDNVHQAAHELSQSTTIQPVDLRDTQRVIDTTIAYMESCAASSTIPSVSGMMRALGLARSTFYDCLQRHSPKQTAEFFERAHDTFAELMSNATLRGEVNTIGGIFLLKSLYKFREQPAEIVVTQGNTQNPFDELAPEEAAAELAAKYSDIPDD